MIEAVDRMREVHGATSDKRALGGVLRVGAFNAESYWRPAGRATLPAVSDPAAADVIVTMDELLVPWRNPGGTLATMLPMEQAQAHHLSKLGVDFKRQPLHGSVEEWRAAGKPACSYEVAAEGLRKGASTWPDIPISPYAITASFGALARCCGQSGRWPEADDVARVNSKVFSTQLNQRFFPQAKVVVIRSLSDLQRFATEISGRPFLLKDPFGVSGKGHFLVKHEASLSRLMKLFAEQIEAGLELEFVAEAFLEKRSDFSCFCEISPRGEARICGVQRMHNNAFSYRGSQPADVEFSGQLQRRGYFEMLEPFLNALYEERYWGPVCIDSMQLADGTLWPVVEINARESMGIVAKSICDFLTLHGTTGLLTFLGLSARTVQPYEQLLAALSRHGMLWHPGQSQGILPLSSASLYVTHDQEKEGLRKGRWYAMLVAKTESEQAALRDRWTSVCAAEFGWQLPWASPQHS